MKSPECAYLWQILNVLGIEATIYGERPKKEKNLQLIYFHKKSRLLRTSFSVVFSALFFCDADNFNVKN